VCDGMMMVQYASISLAKVRGQYMNVSDSPFVLIFLIEILRFPRFFYFLSITIIYTTIDDTFLNTCLLPIL
jgi:hypothetical protein